MRLQLDYCISGLKILFPESVGSARVQSSGCRRFQRTAEEGQCCAISSGTRPPTDRVGYQSREAPAASAAICDGSINNGGIV